MFRCLTIDQCAVDVYYVAFPNDRKLLKLAVTWVYLIGTAQTIMAVTDIYNAFHDFLNSCNPSFGLRTHAWLTVIAFSAFGEDLCVPDAILSWTKFKLIVVSGFDDPNPLCL